MLWPTGYLDVDMQPTAALEQNFTSLAKLYKAARLGVQDAVGKGIHRPEIMIHIDDGWNSTLEERWFAAFVSAGVPTSAWDVFGFSFYPFYGTEATFSNLETTLKQLAKRYNKPIHIVETDYPSICNGEYNPIPPSSQPEIPYSVQGQFEWVTELIKIVKDTPYGLGRGVWYWEPAWLNNTSLGSNCSDAVLFRPDYSQWPKTTGFSRSSVKFFR